MNDTAEPIYYISTSFSGVGFLLPGQPMTGDWVVLTPAAVDPDVREQGRRWLAAQTEAVS